MNHSVIPSISVIIPVFNAEQTIKRSIDSALIQQNVDLEIIVIDDCSTDSTPDIVLELAEQYQQITLLKTVKNSGPSVARNLGIGEAQNAWVALLDADDWFAEGRLETLYKKAISHDLDFIADCYYLIREDDEKPHAIKFSKYSDANSVEIIDVDEFITVGLGSIKPLIKKDFITVTHTKFNEDLFRGEDFLFFVTLMIRGARFGLLNSTMYYRCINPMSLSRFDKDGLYIDLYNVFNDLKDNLAKTDLLDMSVLKSIKYRLQVTQDARASHQWKRWIGFPQWSTIPSFGSFFRALRHLLLKKRRYQLTDVS